MGYGCLMRAYLKTWALIVGVPIVVFAAVAGLGGSYELGLLVLAGVVSYAAWRMRD